MGRKHLNGPATHINKEDILGVKVIRLVSLVHYEGDCTMVEDVDPNPDSESWFEIEVLCGPTYLDDPYHGNMSTRIVITNGFEYYTLRKPYLDHYLILGPGVKEIIGERVKDWITEEKI